MSGVVSGGALGATAGSESLSSSSSEDDCRLSLISSILSSNAAMSISLSELDQKTKYVILGYVEKIVESNKESDTIKIRVVTILKGMLHHAGHIEIRLRNKGVKDFDPNLKVGDKGIFFLSAVFI